MSKYLVKVVETFEHTFLVEAESKEKVEDIVNRSPDGSCDPYDDIIDTEYVTREVTPNDDLDLYDEIEGKEE